MTYCSTPHPHRVEGMATVKRFKVKIVKLYSARLDRGTIEMPNQDTLQNEPMSLFHLIKRGQRREKRTITKVQDQFSGTQTTTMGFVNVFISFLRQKFSPILADDECVKQMAVTAQTRLTEDWNEVLDKPITSDELQVAMQKGEGNKAPGRDGVGFEFFKATWGALKDDMLDLFNQMFATNNVLE